MKLHITAFKDTGKFYLDNIVTYDTDIPIHRPEFKTFIQNNAPALPTGGFVLVQDEPENKTFHTHLFHVDRAGQLY